MKKVLYRRARSSRAARCRRGRGALVCRSQRLQAGNRRAGRKRHRSPPGHRRRHRSFFAAPPDGRRQRGSSRECAQRGGGGHVAAGLGGGSRCLGAPFERNRKDRAGDPGGAGDRIGAVRRRQQQLDLIFCRGKRRTRRRAGGCGPRSAVRRDRHRERHADLPPARPGGAGSRGLVCVPPRRH